MFGLSRLTLALLAVALLFRLALVFPAHKYPADADCSLSALCALEILHGRPAIFFPGGVRLGAAGCYVTAGMFGLFGVTRGALAAGPLLVGCAMALAWFAFYRELLGERAADTALLFIAIPAPAFSFWTYMPNAYPEVLLACALVLWLTARADRRGLDGRGAFALGLAIGFGLWCSLQTLTCSLPALAWLAYRHRRRLASAHWISGVIGALVGAAPWLLFNVLEPLGTFRGNFAARPAGGIRAVLANTDYLFRYQLPELLASSSSPLQTGMPPSLAERAGPLILILFSVAALWAAFVAWRRADPSTPDPRADPSTPDLRPPLALLLGVAATVALFDVISEAATYRGLSVRYILPLYLLVPGFLALAASRLSGRLRPVAVAAAVLILMYNAAGSRLPGTHWRSALASAAENDQRVLQTLRDARVEAVIGSYWTVYPLNFLGYQQLRAVPLEAQADFDGVEARLGARPARWALLGSSPKEVQRLLAASGLAGRPLVLAGVTGSLIDGRHDAASLAARLRSASAPP